MEDLRQSEERFRHLVEHGLESVSILRPDGSIVYTSPATSRMLGYSFDELLAINALDLVHPDDAERARRLLAQIVETSGRSLMTTLRISAKDGDIHWLRIAATNVMHIPSIAGVVLHMNDVTEQRDTETGLRTSEAKLRQIIEHSTNLFYTHTAQHEITYASPQVEKFLDATQEEARKRWMEFATDNPANQLAFESTARAIQTGIPQPPYELELVGLKGRKIWVEVHESPVVVDGKTVEIVGSLTDITDRKRSEEKLRRSEEYFRSLIENASDVVTVLDRKGVILYASPSMERLFGYPLSQLIGRNMVHFIHPDDQMKIIRTFALGLSQPGMRNRSSARFLCADGTWRIVDSVGTAVRDPDGQTIGVINSRDITDRIASEQRLRESEERYRNFFEDDLSGAYISKPDGTIVDCNPAFVRMFGFSSAEEARRTHAGSLYRSTEDRKRLLEMLRKEKKLEYHPIELRRKDGSILYAVGNIAGTFDAEGMLLSMKGYLFDDTKRRELEKELVHAQKMESLGRLAGGIAHDFNNLLAIILGQASLGAKYTSDPDRVKRSMETIEKATLRGADLVKQLLTFARKTEVTLGSVDLNASVQEVTAFLKVTFPRTIEISTRLTENLPPVSGDGTQIYQVLLNLCVNARDAMPDGGLLTLSTSLMERREVRKYHSNATALAYARIIVSDTGAGMDDATMRRIFEPFFTTKELGKGTGLGLSVAFGIVETHHGFIDVESAPDRGTMFRVYLPIQEVHTSATGAAIPRAAASSGGTETVLIIEDEDLLRNMLMVALQERGYQVLTAVDGESGLVEFDRNKDTIDLVVTDMGLPKIGGRQVIRELMALRKDLRIIVMSGYLEPGVRSDILNEGVRAVLQKPFVTEELLRTMREVLDVRLRSAGS